MEERKVFDVKMAKFKAIIARLPIFPICIKYMVRAEQAFFVKAYACVFLTFG